MVEIPVPVKLEEPIGDLVMSEIEIYTTLARVRFHWPTVLL
jgi:hypothetical protein